MTAGERKVQRAKLHWGLPKWPACAPGRKPGEVWFHKKMWFYRALDLERKERERN